MAITNYTELQTAIGNWIDRTNLTARIPEFISLSEAKFNRKFMRFPAPPIQMEAIATGTLSSGTNTISFETDHLQLSKVQLNAATTIILEQMGKEMLERKFPYTTTGTPKAFTINGNQIEVAPKADADYTYEISYLQKIPDLATNTTNWLLTLYPDVYLYGGLLEAAPYLKGADVAVWKGLYDEIIDEIRSASHNARWSGGTLMMRVV